MKDTRAYLGRLSNIFVKYKYVMIVAAVGLLLIAWPFGRDGEQGQTETNEPAPAYTADTSEMETKLVSLLGRVDGVGRVEVMLSLASDMEYVLRTSIRGLSTKAARMAGRPRPPLRRA